MTGYVYAIAAGDLVKIGWSSDPARRCDKIRADNGNEVRLLGAIKATTTDEKRLHRLMASERLTGEWFKRGRLVEHFLSRLPEYKVEERGTKIVARGLHDWLRNNGISVADFGKSVGVTEWAVYCWLWRCLTCWLNTASWMTTTFARSRP